MSIETQKTTPLAQAVRAAGSQSAFGRLIGKRQSTVREWLVHDKALPAEHVLKIEAQLGISRHVLRPDIYPVEHGETPVVSAASLHVIGVPVESNAEPLVA